MNNKTFDLYIPRKDCESFEVGKDNIFISNIRIESFMFPDQMDCEDVAEILSKEDEIDLLQIFEALQKKLKSQDINFTFKLKGKVER